MRATPLGAACCRTLTAVSFALCLGCGGATSPTPEPSAIPYDVDVFRLGAAAARADGTLVGVATPLRVEVYSRWGVQGTCVTDFGDGTPPVPGEWTASYIEPFTFRAYACDTAHTFTRTGRFFMRMTLASGSWTASVEQGIEVSSLTGTWLGYRRPDDVVPSFELQLEQEGSTVRGTGLANPGANPTRCDLTDGKVWAMSRDDKLDDQFHVKFKCRTSRTDWFEISTAHPFARLEEEPLGYGFFFIRQ